MTETGRSKHNITQNICKVDIRAEAWGPGSSTSDPATPHIHHFLGYALAASRWLAFYSLHAGHRPTSFFFPTPAVLARKIIVLAGSSFFTKTYDKTCVEQKKSDMSLFSVQWWLHRDNSDDHGPYATTSSAKVATKVAVQRHLNIQSYICYKVITNNSFFKIKNKSSFYFLLHRFLSP